MVRNFLHNPFNEAVPTLWHCPILCCREVSLQGRLERIHICLLLINTKESIHDLGGLFSVLAVLRKFSSKLRDDHEMRLLTLKWIYSVITSDSRIRVNASSSFLSFQRHSFSWIHIILWFLPRIVMNQSFFQLPDHPLWHNWHPRNIFPQGLLWTS